MKILINEKEYGLVWGIAAIDRYCGMMDMEIEPALDLIFVPQSGLGAFKQTKALAKFVACAAESYSVLHNDGNHVTYQEVLNEFDDKGPVLIQSILADFMTSKLLGQTVSDFLNIVIETADSKKVAKKKQVAPKS